MSIRMKTSALYDELRRISTKSSVENVMTFLQMSGLCESVGKGVVKVDEHWEETLKTNMDQPEVGDIVYTFGRGTHLVIDTTPKLANGTELDNTKYFTGYKLNSSVDGSYSLSGTGGSSNLETSETMRLRQGHFDMKKVRKLVDRKAKITKDLEEVTNEINCTKEKPE